MGSDAVAVSVPDDDRPGLQPAHARDVRRNFRALVDRKLSAFRRSHLSRNPVAIFLDCRRLNSYLSSARLSAGPVYFACWKAQEPLSQSRDSPVLDQLPGSNLCLDVPAARHRAGQLYATETWDHPRSLAAAV